MLDINEFYIPEKRKSCLSHEALNPVVTEAGSVIIYGAGFNGIHALQVLRKHGVEPLCFVDSDKEKQGQLLLGTPIKSVDDMDNFNKELLIVITPVSGSVQIERVLREKGFSKFLLSEINHNTYYMLKGFLSGLEQKKEILKNNQQKIDVVLHKLQDQKSRDVFNATLKVWLEGDSSDAKALLEDNAYFPENIINLSETEVFIDCGAYQGETAYEFTKRVNGRYRKIYSFEPDPFNFEMAKAFIKLKRVANFEIHQMGVFKEKGTVTFSGKGTVGSRISEGGEITVAVDSLDNMLCECMPTYIKMDIEGAELDALKGCSKILDWNYPKLAICVYHKFEDLWEIPYYIMEYFPEYQVFLRKHGEYAETICYAKR